MGYSEHCRFFSGHSIKPVLNRSGSRWIELNDDQKVSLETRHKGETSAVNLQLL